ncbi:MAG: hypothetical protein V2A76_07150 [Planctomycetota bacterium]
MDFRTGPFLSIPLAAALLFGPLAAADEAYSLTRISADSKAASEAQGEPDRGTLPEEVPEAFLAELQPDGLRLAARDGSPIYDLWLRKEPPLAGVRSKELSVKYDQLEVGTLVGVLRAYGAEVDYYENPVGKGVYLLRYGVQPDSGDHMGTAESRDFLLLTRFQDDRKPDRVEKMDDLIKLAIAAAPNEHPMILFLEKPSDLEADSPRLYRHERRDEWIADLPLKTRAADKEECAELRLGIVLIGVSEHY